MAPMTSPFTPPNRFLARLIDHIIVGVVMGVSYAVLSAIFLGFSNLISCMILYCATAQMHFCFVLIYIVLELIDFI